MCKTHMRQMGLESYISYKKIGPSFFPNTFNSVITS